MPVLWFHTSMSFQFWSKTLMKCWANNSLLSRDKKFLPCLNWVVTCFQFQKMFWKNNCFRFWWRTYTKHCRRNYVISCVKRLPSLHFAVGQVLSISGYDLEHRCWVSKNIALKTWRWKFLFDFASLLFTLLT